MSATFHRNSPGFTLVEVLIIAPIAILVIGAFIAIIVSLTGKALEERANSSIIYQTNAALESIKNDARLSNTFLATNSITPLVSPQGQNGATQAFSNGQASDKATLILKSFATKGTSSLADRSLVWLKDDPNACDSDNVNQNNPMQINVVYFLKDGALWRRTIMPSNYASIGCSDPAERPSCQLGQTEAICKARDEMVLDGVETFQLSYYSSGTADSPLSGATDAVSTSSVRQSILDTANTVEVHIKVKKTVAGRDIKYSITGQVTQLN